jgi:hypothetical protein
LSSNYSSANIIGMMNKEFKLKLMSYFKNDYEMMKNEEGDVEVFNSGGGVEEVLSKDEYFSELKKVKSFEDLEGFWQFVGGENGMGVGGLIDEILKEKIA